jgi:hypothetical protein
MKIYTEDSICWWQAILLFAGFKNSLLSWGQYAKHIMDDDDVDVPTATNTKFSFVSYDKTERYHHGTLYSRTQNNDIR